MTSYYMRSSDWCSDVCSADRARFALLSGLGIGTVGLAGEYLWNADAWQPWTTNLFPEVIGFGIVGGVGAAVLGAAFARAIERDATVRPLSALLVAGAAIACLAVEIGRTHV